MAQKFGFEVECFGLTESQVGEAIESVEGLAYAGHFGYHGSRHLGLRCKENNNGHLWVSEHDGSLSWSMAEAGGIAHEVISPIMEGEEGIRTVGRVMTALSKAGAKVNRSCGLHVTFGITNSHARFKRMSKKTQARCIANLVDAYYYFTAGFESLVPMSRRTTNRNGRSGYASPIYYYNMEGCMFGQHTNESAQVVVREGVGRGVLNIGNFLSKGIIEFRQHNGTLNRWKIMNWALLCQRLVQWAVSTAHVNHGCDIREFPPTFEGLLDMLAVGSDLRTALEARRSELPAVEVEETKMRLYENFHLARILENAGGVE